MDDSLDEVVGCLEVKVGGSKPRSELSGIQIRELRAQGDD